MEHYIDEIVEDIASFTPNIDAILDNLRNNEMIEVVSDNLTLEVNELYTSADITNNLFILETLFRQEFDTHIKGTDFEDMYHDLHETMIDNLIVTFLKNFYNSLVEMESLMTTLIRNEKSSLINEIYDIFYRRLQYFIVERVFKTICDNTVELNMINDVLKPNNLSAYYTSIGIGSNKINIVSNIDDTLAWCKDHFESNIVSIENFLGDNTDEYPLIVEKFDIMFFSSNIFSKLFNSFYNDEEKYDKLKFLIEDRFIGDR